MVREGETKQRRIRKKRGGKNGVEVKDREWWVGDSPKTVRKEKREFENII